MKTMPKIIIGTLVVAAIFTAIGLWQKFKSLPPTTQPLVAVAKLLNIQAAPLTVAAPLQAPKAAPATPAQFSVDPKIWAFHHFKDDPVLGKSPGLTDAQAAKIEAALERLRAARKIIEARIAYLEVDNPDEKIIVVPPYAKEARPLVDDLINSVAQATDDETAARFMVDSGIGRIEGATGQTQKVIDVRPSQTPGIYDITIIQDILSMHGVAVRHVNSQNLPNLNDIKKFIASN